MSNSLTQSIDESVQRRPQQALLQRYTGESPLVSLSAAVGAAC